MEAKKKKKRGRPKGSLGKKRADVVLPPIRLYKEQLESYKAKADALDMTLSSWVKKTLDRAAKRKVK